MIIQLGWVQEQFPSPYGVMEFEQAATKRLMRELLIVSVPLRG